VKRAQLIPKKPAFHENRAILSAVRAPVMINGAAKRVAFFACLVSQFVFSGEVQLIRLVERTYRSRICLHG